jgi:hypothetical protein
MRRLGRAAFDDAKQSISSREQRENQKPSDPQADFGGNLMQALESLH